MPTFLQALSSKQVAMVTWSLSSSSRAPSFPARRQRTLLGQQQEIGKARPHGAVPAVEDDGRRYLRAPLQALRDGAAPGQVLVAGDDNQVMVRVYFKESSGTFGHTFVPQQLGLEEMLEVVPFIYWDDSRIPF